MESHPQVSVGSDLASWLDVAAVVLRAADEVRRSTCSSMMPAGAPAVIDRDRLLRDYGSRDVAERVLWIVNGWTIVAGSHLSGLAALCEAREIVFSLAPIARSAFEYSNRTVWILAEKLDPNQRLARVLLEELRGAVEACKITSHFAGKGSESHKVARDALGDQRAEIMRIFPESSIEGSQKDWQVAGEHLASPTDSVRHYGDRWGGPREWAGVYELLSGHSHPGTTVFEFFDTDEDGQPITATHRDAVEKTLRMAVVPYHHALLHLRAYCGWSSAALDDWEAQLLEVFVPRTDR